MATRDVKVLEQDFFFSKRLILLALRVYFNDNSKNHFLIFCIVTCYLLPMAINLVYELLTTSFNLEKAIMELRKAFGGLIMFLSYSTINFHHVTWKFLLIRIIQDWKQLSDNELKIMKKYDKENKFYAYVIVVLFSFYVISITSSCIFKIVLYFFGLLDINQLTLPLATNNNSYSETLYFCLFIYQIIGFYMLLIIGIICITTYLVIVQHACCQYNIIIWKIQQMFKSDQEYVSKDLDPEIQLLDEFNWIVDIIVSYRKLTEYIDSINYNSQVIYLIAIFLAMLLVIVDLIYIFQLPIVWQNVPKIIEFIIYVAGSLFTIYINFNIGQKLLNFNEDVFKELCQIPFYLLSKKTRYILLFLIRRSLKTCGLSIGGLFVSSHEVFSGLMQKAFSFAMMYSKVSEN